MRMLRGGAQLLAGLLRAVSRYVPARNQYAVSIPTQIATANVTPKVTVT